MTGLWAEGVWDQIRVWIPAFNPYAGLIAFGVVTVSGIAVLLWAMYHPKIAIERLHRAQGGSPFKTASAVTTVSTLLGVTAGLASGLFWGAGGGALPMAGPISSTSPNVSTNPTTKDTTTKPEPEIASELAVYFEPRSGAPDLARSFFCKAQPRSKDKAVGAPREVKGNTKSEFEKAFEDAVDRWRAEVATQSKNPNAKVQVTIYTKPDPGSNESDALQLILKGRPNVKYQVVANEYQQDK